MNTLIYTLTYPILADSRLEAIMVAGRKLRTGVRVVELVSAEQGLPGWWDVELRVAEDLGVDDPPEPEWLPQDPPEYTDDLTYAKWFAERVR